LKRSFFGKNTGVYILATFWSLGKTIGPSRKKISKLKKFKIYIENLFSITTLALKSNTLSFSFITREAQFSLGKDSAQTTKALMNHILGRISPHSNIVYFLDTKGGRCKTKIFGKI
jgi:hypothetical protein